MGVINLKFKGELAAVYVLCSCSPRRHELIIPISSFTQCIDLQVQGPTYPKPPYLPVPFITQAV
jgi:hypothetical protein